MIDLAKNRVLQFAQHDAKGQKATVFSNISAIDRLCLCNRRQNVVQTCYSRLVP